MPRKTVVWDFGNIRLLNSQNARTPKDQPPKMASDTLPTLPTLAANRSPESPKSPKPAKAPPAPRGRTEPWRATILGELASKANSRKLVTLHGLPRFIKSDKARAYLPALMLQVPVLNPMFEDELTISVTAFYTSHRPDLDISLLLDALQGRVYRNDRLVREQHLYHAIDKANPRVEVSLCLREPVPSRAFSDSAV